MRLHYTYDDANRRIGLALPDGQQQSWGYDPAGRVNGVIQPGGGSWTVAHNGAGQPTMASLPNGGSQVWGYDTAGRPTSATWLQAGNPTFSQVATLDPAGQRKGLADSWGTVTYGYDRAGRLTSAGYPDGSTEADSYDPAGNRTAITATTPLSGTAVTTNGYDAADQLSTAVTGGPQPGTTTYAYDGNGNQTSSSGPAGTTSNTFNNLNQLTHIVGPGTNLTLLYDGQGDRLRSYERGTPTWTLRNEAQDLAGGLSALVSDGTADYGYLSPGNGSAPLSSYTPGTSRATYLATDLLGSVRLATDPSGATIGAGAYDAWGNARPYSGGSGATQLAGLQGVAPFGYAGQQRDAGLGTYAMRARRYDPSTGRFQSQDPLAYSPQVPVTINPYEYAGNMPTGVTDPSGKGWTRPLPGAPGNFYEAAILADLWSRLTVPAHNTGGSHPLPVPGVEPMQVGWYQNVPIRAVVVQRCGTNTLRISWAVANVLHLPTLQIWDIEDVKVYQENPRRTIDYVQLLARLMHNNGYRLPGDTSWRTGDNVVPGKVPPEEMRADAEVTGVQPTPTATPTPQAASAVPYQGILHHTVSSRGSKAAITWWYAGDGLILYTAVPTQQAQDTCGGDALSTCKDKSFFWAGAVDKGDGIHPARLESVEGDAATWATQNGGTTLEMLLAARALPSPGNDLETWKSFSVQFARGAKGLVRALIGTYVRPDL